MRIYRGNKVNRTLFLNILSLQTPFQILNQSTQNMQEMLCFANISRHSLLQNIIRQGRVCKPSIRDRKISSLCQTINEPVVLCTQSTSISGLEPTCQSPDASYSDSFWHLQVSASSH